MVVLYPISKHRRSMLIRAGAKKQIAASRIQRAWRRRRKGKNKAFKRKVNAIALSRDPTQYRIYGSQGTDLSQAPVVIQNFSNLKALQSTTNPRFYRSSMKIKAMNLHVDIRIDYRDTFNQVCFALVRHKRSEPIVSADLQYTGTGGTGANVQGQDNVFMDCTAPNENFTNMLGLSTVARPKLLLALFNPKVVDVMKTWTVNLQNPNITGNYTSNFKPYRDISFNHKFNEIWKYPAMRDPDTEETTFPYNNKCYSLIGWSDSVNLTAHPQCALQCRFSFKDLD